MTLWDLDKNAQARITSFSKEMPQPYCLRLRELGFEKSTTITCQRKAPFGGPRTYQLGDSVFSIEKSIGALVNIEPVHHTKETQSEQ